MNKNQEFDWPFDNNAAAHEPPLRAVGDGSGASPSGTVTEAVVKWFRSDKGYGFVELAGGRGDAFLHLKACGPSDGKRRRSAQSFASWSTRALGARR